MSAEHYVKCPTCNGRGCEYGCGNCTMSPSTVGPDAHKVCQECGGSGVKSSEGGDVSVKSRPLTVTEWERRYSDLMETAERLRDQAEHRQAVILDLGRQLAAIRDDLDMARKQRAVLQQDAQALREELAARTGGMCL